jgi:hypothetical protein
MLSEAQAFETPQEWSILRTMFPPYWPAAALAVPEHAGFYLSFSQEGTDET